MPRKLFILRHGEAESDRKWLDIDRPLTKVGKKAIHQVGQKLRSAQKIDLIIASPSKRTRETSLAILSELGYQPGVNFESELYNASMKQVLESLDGIKNYQNAVLVIGHNPSLSELATYLLGQGHISMGPGQLIEIDLSIGEWIEISSGCGMIVAS